MISVSSIKALAWTAASAQMIVRIVCLVGLCLCSILTFLLLYFLNAAYDTYDKPLFRGSSANAIYRPKAVDTDTYGGDEVKSLIEKSTTKFTADRGFKGAEKGAPVSG